MVTALGNDVATTWEGLLAGRSGIRTIEAFDPSRLTSRVAAEVHDFDASGVLDRKELRRTDRYIQFGLVAAREALDQAGLPKRFEGDLADRTGVILGTGLGGVGTLIDGFAINALRGPDRISPFLIPMGIPNIGSGQIAIQFGMTGPNFTTVSACATGGHALGESSEIIRRGDADIMVAGDAEAADDRMRREPMSAAVRRLDLAILHAAILDDRLGIDPASVATGYALAYTRSEADAIRAVASGEAKAATTASSWLPKA